MKTLKPFALRIIPCMMLAVLSPAYSQPSSVADALDNIRQVVIARDHQPAVMMAAKQILASDSSIRVVADDLDLQPGQFKISIFPPSAQNGQHTYEVRLQADGSGTLTASTPTLAFAVAALLAEDWKHDDLTALQDGRSGQTAFRWLIGRDLCFGSRKRYAQNYDPEKMVIQTARMAATGVIINSLAQQLPIEQNTTGEIYYRFYVTGADFDQYVETALNQGIYPPEYLSANMALLEKNAALANKFGLTAGMHIANPRSVPNALLQRHPHLRGARVDHPYRAFEPRYTLATSHPVVRWHYANMLQQIMQRIPNLSFLSTWLNDSGSGFEFTSRLYPGRNGGPYLVREWRSNETIAIAAAKNLTRYYQTLVQTGQAINPDFRIVAGIRAVPEEKPEILSRLSPGVDIHAGKSEILSANLSKNKQATQQDPAMHGRLDARGHAIIMGVPFPWFVHGQLQEYHNAGLQHLTVYFDPPSLSPYNINREVIRRFQLNPDLDIDVVLADIAQNWAGEASSGLLLELWRLIDEIKQAAPKVPLYDGYGFVPYRLWVRPLVPDIAAIPEAEREYYQKYMISVFNNRQNIDLNADALWNFFTVAEADAKIKKYDEQVLPKFASAIALTEKVDGTRIQDSQMRQAMLHTIAAIRLYRNYHVTLRNVLAWIAGTHGYLKGQTEEEKAVRLHQLKHMMRSEHDNMLDLLAGWPDDVRLAMPLYAHGETWYMYGENLPDLIRQKIKLMQQHGDRLPQINADYMWRMPAGFGVPDSVFLKY